MASHKAPCATPVIIYPPGWSFKNSNPRDFTSGTSKHVSCWPFVGYNPQNQRQLDMMAERRSSPGKLADGPAWVT
jgi:hypothetical protein